MLLLYAANLASGLWLIFPYRVMFVDLLEAVVKVDRSDIISNLIQHGSFLTNWLNFGRSAPLGRGFAWGQFFLASPYYSQRAVHVCVSLSAFPLKLLWITHSWIDDTMMAEILSPGQLEPVQIRALKDNRWRLSFHKPVKLRWINIRPVSVRRDSYAILSKLLDLRGCLHYLIPIGSQTTT